MPLTTAIAILSVGVTIAGGCIGTAYLYGTMQLKAEFKVIKKELQHIGTRMDDSRHDRQDIYEKIRQLDRDKVSRRDCPECED